MSETTHLSRFWGAIWKSFLFPYRMLRYLKKEQENFSTWYFWEWICASILFLFGSSTLLGLVQWQRHDELSVLFGTLIAYLIFVALNLIGYGLKTVAEMGPGTYD
ncbi:hypothetical protein KJ819_03455 [Patescibacteria group bacterium]|nr:hypothetical protein [Patescibacteria group bacterium]MBU1500526.1 hypothetical protein [Patescibacteria group bacterium]MBU2080675.1 hypothetical protein [Patescibacteria group bacterium]MBU2123780.1 hypothetical protein [Patescibacteria group bacterium]MBU2194929.1 hypothetical protein [Patescibacteria group bacterium]